ncbi:MAG: 1-phosphofructokinase family hexose kinase, partial [Eubacterium sp.]|nr:1-phosphofructokinase family hexose kinase [Eubacterium sp.]
MICTVTLNPAIDRILYIREFTPNRTTRIKEKVDTLGGKGTHVSVNLSLLGCRNRAFGVDFGDNGKAIEKMMESDYIDMRFLHYENGESRTNYALIEENLNCTLVTEKGLVVPEEICLQVMERIVEETDPGDILILSGDASNTELPHMYNMIMERLEGKGVKFFLDSSADNLKEGLKKK